MSDKIPVLTLFNNKGGVGKTALAYNMACMMEDMELRVLVCDLDPQADLTALFLGADALEELWADDSPEPNTIHRCVRPLVDGGDAVPPKLCKISANLSLLPGDLDLCDFERHPPAVLDGKQARRPLRLLSAFWRVAQMGAKQLGADLILMDAGPGLGGINHCALLASDFFITPLSVDVYSRQGLRNMGPTIRRWRGEWRELRGAHPGKIDFAIPAADMRPIGYVVNQPRMMLMDGTAQAYDRWVGRIPNDYRKFILDEPEDFPADKPPEDDEHRLAMTRHYISLVFMAKEAHKPIFRLTAADGATGSHYTAVQSARADFKALTLKILERMKVPPPAD